MTRRDPASHWRDAQRDLSKSQFWTILILCVVVFSLGITIGLNPVLSRWLITIPAIIGDSILHLFAGGFSV